MAGVWRKQAWPCILRAIGNGLRSALNVEFMLMCGMNPVEAADVSEIEAEGDLDPASAICEAEAILDTARRYAARSNRDTIDAMPAALAEGQRTNSREALAGVTRRGFNLARLGAARGGDWAATGMLAALLVGLALLTCIAMGGLTMAGFSTRVFL